MPLEIDSGKTGITDVKMPGVNGRDLARVLRQLFPSLQVLYTSGHGDLSWAGAF